MKRRHTRRKTRSKRTHSRKTRSKRTHSRKTRSHKYKKGGNYTIEAIFLIDDRPRALSYMNGNEIKDIQKALEDKFNVVSGYNYNENETRITSLYKSPFYIINPSEDFKNKFLDREKPFDLFDSNNNSDYDIKVIFRTVE
jgi:hypothetical protein